MFLEKQSKLLLIAPIGTMTANISRTTVYNALNMDN